MRPLNAADGSVQVGSRQHGRSLRGSAAVLHGGAAEVEKCGPQMRERMALYSSYASMHSQRDQALQAPLDTAAINAWRAKVQHASCAGGQTLLDAASGS